LRSPQEYPDSAASRKWAIKGGGILGGIGEIGVSAKPSVQSLPDSPLQMIHHPAGGYDIYAAGAWLAAISTGKGDCSALVHIKAVGKASQSLYI